MSHTITITQTHERVDTAHLYGKDSIDASKQEGAIGDLNSKTVVKKDDKGFFGNLFSRSTPKAPATSTPLVAAKIEEDDQPYEPDATPVEIHNAPTKEEALEAVKDAKPHFVTRIVTGRTERRENTSSPTYAKITHLLDRLTNATTLVEKGKNEDGIDVLEIQENLLHIPGTTTFLLRETEAERAVVQTVLKSLNVLKSASEYFVADGKVGIVVTAILTAIAAIVRATVFVGGRGLTAFVSLLGAMFYGAVLLIGGLIYLIGLALKDFAYPAMKFLLKLIALIPLLLLDMVLVPIQKAGEKNGRVFIEKTPFQSLVGSFLTDPAEIEKRRKETGDAIRKSSESDRPSTPTSTTSVSSSTSTSSERLRLTDPIVLEDVDDEHDTAII